MTEHSPLQRYCCPRRGQKLGFLGSGRGFRFWNFRPGLRSLITDHSNAYLAVPGEHRKLWCCNNRLTGLAQHMCYFCTLECETRPKIGAKSSHCNIFLSRFRRETAPRQCETGYLIQLSDRCTELREYLGFCRGIGWIGHIGIYN